MNTLTKPQKLFYLALGLIITLVSILVALIQPPKSNSPVSQPVQTGECSVAKPETVRGNSLAPILNPGDEITVQYGYYQCRQVNRGDIIAYNFAGNPEPIIKIVKALPGDELKLKKLEGSNCWEVLVNEQVLKTSENQDYCLPEPRQKMLELYQGIIAENAYLILGNLAQGSLDSTRFGLVHKTDILGKVKR